MKNVFRTAILGAASLCAFSQAQMVLAQASAPDVVDGGEATDIVVTAQRRSENVRDVPISVGVINGDGLRDYQSAGADTLLSLSGKVPSLYVESTTGRIFPRFYIRGLGNIDFYLGASQPVSIIHDDVVLEHVVLKSNPAFDIAQVEVLRGPQGSLFGRNTTAGIIKFDTMQPTETAQGQINASWGSHNSINVDAGVGGPVTDDGRISVRFSALYQHRDNFIDNVFTGTSADGTKTPQNNVMGGFDERDVRATARAAKPPAGAGSTQPLGKEISTIAVQKERTRAGIMASGYAKTTSTQASRLSIRFGLARGSPALNECQLSESENPAPNVRFVGDCVAVCSDICQR